MSNFWRGNKAKKRALLCFGVFVMLFLFWHFGFGFGVSQALAQAAKPAPAGSDVGNWSSALGKIIGFIVGIIAFIIIEVFSWLLEILIGLLFYVAQMNNFIYVTAVRVGWVIVRDIANTFFILALILIAFGTILQKQKYSYKSGLLPKLFMEAILVNFSRTICGLFIDLSQVVMITFIKAVQGNVGANVFLAGIGLDKAFSYSQAPQINVFDTSNLPLIASIIIATMAIVALTLVVGVFLAVLVMRIVMLWTLVILSPLPYLLNVFPNFQGEAAKWWQKFTQFVVIGPILAFFLYLVVAILASGALASDLKVASAELPKGGAGATGKSDFTKPENFLSFIVVLALLIAGLEQASSIGGFAGALAKSASESIRRGGPLAKGARAVGGYAAAWQKQYTGLELRPSKIYDGLAAGFKSARDERERRGAEKAREQMLKGGALGLAAAATGAPEFAQRYLPAFVGMKGGWNMLNKNRFKANAQDFRSKADDAKKKADGLKAERDDTVSNIAHKIGEDVGEGRINEADFMLAAQRNFNRSKGRTDDAALSGDEVKDAFNFEATRRARKIYDDANPNEGITEIRRLQTQAADYEASAESYEKSTPDDFKLRSLQRKDLNEKKDKFKGMSEDELLLNFKRAMSSGNSKDAAGVALAAAESGDLGAIIKSQTAKEDLGEYGIKKGDRLAADAGGLRAFAEQILGKINKDMEGALLNDLSTLAGKKNLEFAGASKLRPDGSFVPKGRADQNEAALKESDKGNKVENARNRDDSFYATERYRDAKNPGTGTDKYINYAGYEFIKNNFDLMTKQMELKQFNPKAAGVLAQDQNIKIINQIKNEVPDADKLKIDKLISALKAFAGSVDKSSKAMKEKVEKNKRSITLGGGKT